MLEGPTLNQLDDRKESDSSAPVEFVVPAMSSVLVTPSGSVVVTRPLVPAPPIVHRTTWGQPYGTHCTNGTDDKLLKYFIDLQTGCPIDLYTGSLSSFADSQSCLNGAQYKAWFTGYADCFNTSSKHNWDGPKMSFTCWFGGIPTVELPDEDSDSTWNVSPTPKIFLSNANIPRIAYPIAQELPHIRLPIGRNGTGKLEGLLDTGGCSTLGHLPYFMELAKSYPDLVMDVHELQQYRLENINISGVGQGAAVVSHIMEIYMPFIINGTQTKVNIDLAENAPITLFYGLPFQTSAKHKVW
jgi:hypothetical protein